MTLLIPILLAILLFLLAPQMSQIHIQPLREIALKQYCELFSDIKSFCSEWEMLLEFEGKASEKVCYVNESSCQIKVTSLKGATSLFVIARKPFSSQIG